MPDLASMLYVKSGHFDQYWERPRRTGELIRLRGDDDVRAVKLIFH